MPNFGETTSTKVSLILQSILPEPSLSHFVHSFWLLENKTGKDIPSTVLPNGMVDLMMTKVNAGSWKLMIRGIDTLPGEVIIESGIKMFSIGFKLLAVEYLLGDSIKDVLNEGRIIPNDVWQFKKGDLKNLETFSAKAVQIIQSLSVANIDNRKRGLFDLIYSSSGAITVKELSEKAFWSSRQINRYFSHQFGISPKVYCTILRFSASFKHISEGKLYPEQDFTDQNHFIKEVKRYAGVTPKELSKNNNDRFINITAASKFPS